MADFFTEKRREAEQRLNKLRPAHEEYLELERFIEMLDQTGTPRKRGPGRPRGSGTKRRASSSNGRRRRRGGTHADRALKQVKSNPGITVSELASKLGIKHKNYLYRVMNGLESDGVVRKEGRGYTAA